MRFLSLHTIPHPNQLPPLLFPQAQTSSLSLSTRSFSHLNSPHFKGPPFGIAFDIDGVVLRGREPIGGSPRALRRLYDDLGALKIPFLFLTNGGGAPESRRALELSELLGVNILPSQVVQGHSSFRHLLGRYQNELIVATGKGEPALVMREYGFNKVLSLDEYASYFPDIDPVSQYKKWTTMSSADGHNIQERSVPACDVYTERVKAAFVVSDPVDWGRDIQVLCDILRSGGLPGENSGDQPPLYFAADDLEYQAAFPAKRLGSGAFRIALESVFNRVHHKPLEYKMFGKPKPIVFKNAEVILRQLHSTCHIDHNHLSDEDGSYYFKALYMIGDNPPVDIKGARQVISLQCRLTTHFLQEQRMHLAKETRHPNFQAGHPWIPVLTRTGVFRGEGNHKEYPADLVVDTVEDAVDYILQEELCL